MQLKTIPSSALQGSNESAVNGGNKKKQPASDLGKTLAPQKLTVRKAVYLNNANAILQFRVDSTRMDHIIHVATTLCPELVRSANSSSTMTSYTPKHASTSDGDDNAVSSCFLVDRLTGGWSNELFVIENKLTGFKALVRIHPNTNVTLDHNTNDEQLVQGTNVSERSDCTASFEIVDRSVENKLVAWLSTTGDAPTYYGRFQNGRVEEFYNDYVPLNHIEMNTYPAQIAQLMVKLHSKEVPDHIFPSKETSTFVCSQKVSHNFVGSIWERGDNWLRLAIKDLKPESDPKLIEFVREMESEWMSLKSKLMNRFMMHNLHINGRTVDNHIDVHDLTYEQYFARVFCSQIVLTHMDCQSLNILKPTKHETFDKLHSKDDTPKDDAPKDDDSRSTCSTTTTSSSVPSEDEDQDLNGFIGSSESRTNITTIQTKSSNVTTQNQLRLIDYEYAGLNPRAADIANTFCEYCDMNNIKGDYVNEYPTDAIQDEFLTSYLNQTMHSIDVEERNVVSQLDQMISSVWKPEQASTGMDDDNKQKDQQQQHRRRKVLAALRNEIGQYTLLPHIVWAIWSIAQYNHSSVTDYDFIAYARHRMDGYHYFQKRFWGRE